MYLLSVLGSSLNSHNTRNYVSYENSTVHVCQYMKMLNAVFENKIIEREKKIKKRIREKSSMHKIIN